MIREREWRSAVTYKEVAKRLSEDLQSHKKELEEEFREIASVFVVSTIQEEKKVEIKWKEKGGYRFPQKVIETANSFNIEDYPTLSPLMDEPRDILETEMARDREVLTFEDELVLCAYMDLELILHEINEKWSSENNDYAMTFLMVSHHPLIPSGTSTKEFQKIVTSAEFKQSNIVENLLELEPFQFLEEILEGLLKNARSWNTEEIFKEGEKNIEEEGLFVNLEEFLMPSIKQEYKARFNQELPQRHFDRADPAWNQLMAVLSEYHPWDLEMLSQTINASNNIKKWLSGGGLDKKGHKPVCRNSLAEKYCIEQFLNKESIQPIPQKMQDLLLELESNCYSRSIITSSEEGISTDLERRGPVVLYGTAPHHKMQLCQDLLKLPYFGMIQRSFLNETHARTKMPYKELRGYLVENTPDGFEWTKQEPSQVKQDMTTDYSTKEPIA